MRLTSIAVIGTSLFLVPVVISQSPAKRPVRLEDLSRMQQVGNPQLSPDGKWVAYTVTLVDPEVDNRRSSIWMVNWEGTKRVQLSAGLGGASHPQWSPDGKYLAFLSARSAGGRTQIWLLDRRGGEAHPLTDVKQELDDYRWSPDGNRIVLQMTGDGEPEPTGGKPAGGAGPAPHPIVIDRYHFKQDQEGYLTGASRSHIYLFEMETNHLDALTTDKRFDDSDPSWSPDGTKIAFLSNHDEDPDLRGANDLFVAEALPGATPRKVVSAWAPGGQHPVWSPDGKLIAFLQGFEPRYSAYNQLRLAIAPSRGGAFQLLTENLDRGISSIEFTPDGSALSFLVTDDRQEYPAQLSLSGGLVEKLPLPGLVVYQHSRAAGHTAVLAANDSAAPEIYAAESGRARKLTSHNDVLLSELELGAVEDVSFPSKDGTEIHGMIIKPPSYQASKRYPTLLWIHGGPNLQDDHGLQFNSYPLQLERQLLAAHGYVVLAVNYRGSSGRGAAYTSSIFADWGNKEVSDLLAAVDFAVARGVADPERLGVGGWSYGGMLTDYTVAADSRFKAAISGAGIGNELSMYGSDQYIVQYNEEIGPPWKSPETWVKISYPFFHADRIHTPTLFVGGQSDFNVPVGGGEQMYQALRTLGVPTQLVLYPGQFHIFNRPSYIQDRMRRYLAWFDRFLKPNGSD